MTLFNRVGVTVGDAPGVGNITLGSALGASAAIFQPKWQTLEAAGAVDGSVVRYLAFDGNDWEYGQATVSGSSTVLSRPAGSMNGSVRGQKSSTGALLSLGKKAQIFVSAIAEDIISPISTPLTVTNALPRWDGSVGTVPVALKSSNVTLGDNGGMLFPAAGSVIFSDGSPGVTNASQLRVFGRSVGGQMHAWTKDSAGLELDLSLGGKYVPSGGIVSTTVADAIKELDTDKAAIISLSSVAFSGSVADLTGEGTLIKTQVLAGGSAANSNLTLKATTATGDGTEYIAFNLDGAGVTQEGGRIVTTPNTPALYNPIGPKWIVGADHSIPSLEPSGVGTQGFHSQIQLHGVGTVGMTTFRWDNSPSGIFSWVARARSGTPGTHTFPCQGNDVMLNWSSNMSDGVRFLQAIRIRTAVDFTNGVGVATDSSPGKIFIATTPVGTNQPVDRFGIWADGGIQIGGSMISVNPPTNSPPATASPGANVVLLGGQVLAPVTIAGGNTAADHLTLKATTGAGAGTEYISFGLGNNGALEAGRMVNFTGANPGPRFVFGATASISIIQDWSLQLHGGGGLGVGLAKYGADAVGPFWVSAKSRGATPGSHTAVSGNDILFNQQGAGSDGTDFRTAVQIRGRADGAPVATTIPGTNFGMTPGKLFLSTVPNLGTPQGAVTAAVPRIAIFSNGGIQIGGSIDETTTTSPGSNVLDIQTILKKAFAPSMGGYTTGRHYAMIGGGSAVTLATVADTIYWFPFLCGEQHTFTAAGFEVTTAGTATNVRAAVYTSVNGVANTLIVDSGSVAVSSTGVKTAALSGAALNPGTYWLAIKFNGTETLAATSNASLSSFLTQGTTAYAAPTCGVTSAHTFATAYPASAPAFTYAAAFLPIIGLVA